MNANTGVLRYRAFISYSHADQRWARWLHRALESWRPPAHLRGSSGAAPIKRLAPIFLDREELASGTDLGSTVNTALAESANLIVVCSPNAAASRWVNEEVRAFKALGRANRIFCLIVAGDPAADSSTGAMLACFCPALRWQLDADGAPGTAPLEPIAADVRPGKDGKSNAKLKLIAALLDIGLDTLKQRELQRHNRRLGWFATSAVAGMAILAVLSLLALHERDQARFQRAQAEHLIGYMVGDLRSKLEPVNQLDILDGIANHATAYFDAQQDAGDAAARKQRAKAFLLLGGVRLDQGKIADATHAFKAAIAISQSLYDSTPHDSAVAISLIDGQFWLGVSDWQAGHIDDALGHFETALPVLKALLAAHPHDTDALQREAWMRQNIGHIHQARNATELAMEDYLAQLEVSQQLVAFAPGNRSYRRELASAEDNIAALLYAHGKLAQAEQRYQSETALLSRLVREDPSDHDAGSALAIAQSFLAQAAESLGHLDIARSNLQSALAIGEAAVAADPANNAALGNLAAYCRRLGHLFLLDAKPDHAQPLLQRAATLYRKMLNREPSSVRARYGLAATQLAQARLAWIRGEHTLSSQHASAAEHAFAALRTVESYANDAALGQAKSRLLLGSVKRLANRDQAARADWVAALSMLGTQPAQESPDAASTRAELLLLLGRPQEAQPLLAHLTEIHFNRASLPHPAMPNAARSGGGGNDTDRR